VPQKAIAKARSTMPVASGSEMPPDDLLVDGVPAIRMNGQTVEVLDNGSNLLRDLGGSERHAFNGSMLRSVLSSIWVRRNGPNDADAVKAAVQTAAAALRAFKPTDEIEGMLAAQAVAAHHGAMECYRRAMLPDQPSETATKLRKDAANLSRTMADMLGALDRKRGKGPQVIRVERMVVQDGGQAVVGNVQAGSAVLPAPEPKAIGHQVEDITLDGIAAPSLAPARGRGGEKAKRRGRTP